MKRMLAVSVIAMLVGLATLAWTDQCRAADTTLKGSVACGHCVKHEGTKCGLVLEVKEGDKAVSYTLVANDATKEIQKQACGKAVNVTVTGTVEEKDGKKVVTATKVTIDQA